jgi:UDP-N-acetylmuramate dehydrogenase
MGERDAALAILGGRARQDVPLGPLTTLRVGGPADLLVEARDEADLLLVGDAVRASGLPVLVVGKGSNLLVADRGFPGIAVTLGEGFDTVSVDLAAWRVRAGAAVSLPVLARRTATAGLTGFEWAVGVPGSVGGAVRMNAGGHGSDMAAVVTRFRFVDVGGGGGGESGESGGEFDADRLAFAYRHSTVAPTHVVVWAELQLRPGDRARSEREIAEIVRWRREHQPGGQNCGSVFTNPPEDSAGRLIEEAGLKGFAVGSAHVSPKHANFIQADEGGSADDVWALIQEVQRLVAERTGVRLQPEVRLVGFGPMGFDGA